MKGGLERDEWGHPAVISLLFLPLLDLCFLFSLPASLQLSSHSPSIRAISLILTYVSLTCLPWHGTNEYSIVQHAWEHGVPWLTRTHTHTQATLLWADGGLNQRLKLPLSL